MMMVFRGLKRESDGVEDCDGPGIWMTPSHVTFTDSESTIGSKEVGRAVEESNVMVVRWCLTQDCCESRDRWRQWALSSPVIQTRRVDERCSRLCEKELKRLSSSVKCATFDMV